MNKIKKKVKPPETLLEEKSIFLLREKISRALVFLKKSNPYKALTFQILYRFFPDLTLLYFFPAIFAYKMSLFPKEIRQNEKEKLIIKNLRNLILCLTLMILIFFLLV